MSRPWMIFAAGFALASAAAIGLHVAGRPAIATAPATMPVAADLVAAPAAPAETENPAVAASEPSREDKRRRRYDRDRDDLVSREEYLKSRRTAYAKLDSNGDGRLDFEEYARRTALKFSAADADRNGLLNASEFATTAQPQRKKAPDCPPETAAAEADG
jgi:hypothetical protein